MSAVVYFVVVVIVVTVVAPVVVVATVYDTKISRNEATLFGPEKLVAEFELNWGDGGEEGNLFKTKSKVKPSWEALHSLNAEPHLPNVVHKSAKHVQRVTQSSFASSCCCCTFWPICIYKQRE